MRRLCGLLFVALTAAGVAAQQDWWERWGRFRGVPPRMATEDSFDGAFNFCRLMYRSVRREPGGQGWRTDYPDADINLSVRLQELTKMRVSRQESGEPNHLVVRLTDPALFRCPFVMIEDAGTAAFADEEVQRLREYLLKGGFLWVDDFWGPDAWDAWVAELGRVLPPDRYPVRDLALDHPLFRAMYEIRHVPQIPSIQFWRDSGGETSERGADSAVPHVRGVSNTSGHLMVLMTHNTDIADAWERERESPEFFYRFSPDGYEVGVNVLMYAMTH
jgi:hypothetical protein